MSDIDVIELEELKKLKGIPSQEIPTISAEDLSALKENASGVILSVPAKTIQQLKVPQAPDPRLQEAWDEAAMGEKIVNSQILAQQLEMDEKDALAQHDILINLIPGTDGDTKKAFAGFMKGHKYAMAMREMNDLSFQEALGLLQRPEFFDAQIQQEQAKPEPDQEKIEKLQKRRQESQEAFDRIRNLQQTMAQLTPEDARWYMPKIGWTLGQISTQMLQSMQEGFYMSLGTMAAGALAGSLGGPVGALGGAAGGFTFGITAGMTSFNIKQMTGASFRKQIDQGVHPLVARAIAFASGSLQGIAEMISQITMIKALPGVDKALAAAAEQAVRSAVASGTFKAIALNAMKRMAYTGAVETWEEVTQNTIDALADYMAVELTNRYKTKPYVTTRGAPSTYLEPGQPILSHGDWKQFIREQASTVISVFPSAALMAAPGAGFDIITETAEMAKGKKIQKQVARAAAVEELLAEPEKPKEIVREKPIPPEITKVLAETTKEIKQAKPAEPITIGTETFNSEEVKTARQEARKLTVEQLVQEITGTGKRAIGKAFTTGKVLGIEQQKAFQRESLLKQKIYRETRKHVLNLAKVIKKAQEPTSGVAYEYAEGMRAIAAEIDPKFRQERTLQRRQKTLDFIERYPEAAEKIPRSILETARKKALNELIVEDLENVVVQLNRLQRLGRKKRQLQIRADKKEFQTELSGLVDEVYAGREPIEVVGKGRATLAKEGRHNLLKTANVWFLRPQRVIDRIGIGQATFKGKNINSLWNRAQKITNNQMAGADKRVNAGIAKMKELGITPSWLSKTHKIEGITYSNAEILGLYTGSLNELSSVAIQLGNVITEKQMSQFIAKLEPKGKAWANWIIREYEKNRPRLQEAHISYTNKPFYVERNYTPLRYIDAIYETIREELGKELLARERLRKAYADSGFTISRIKNIPKEYRRQVNLDLTGLWLDQVGKQENYILNAKDIRRLQQIVNNRKWTDAVRQKLGREYVKVTQGWVNRVVDPNYYRSYDSANKISSFLRRNTALAYLTLNSTTILKQAPSLALALADVGPRLVSVSLRAPFQAGMMLERMHRLSPQMKRRSIFREAEELKVMDKNLYQKIQQKAGKYGMLPIYAMDKAIVTMVWNGQFEKSLAEGLSENEAAMEADNTVQRTQPAASPKDLAQIFASSEFFNWLNMFGNQLNQIWNMVSYDIPRRFIGGIRKGNPKQVMQAMTGVVGIMVSGTAIWMISNRRVPESKEDLKDITKESFINSIPIVGRSIVQAMRGYEEGGIPIIEQVSKVGSAIFGKGNWRKRLNKVLEAISVIFGIPWTQPKRIFKAIQRGEIRELIGGGPKYR